MYCPDRGIDFSLQIYRKYAKINLSMYNTKNGHAMYMPYMYGGRV